MLAYKIPVIESERGWGKKVDDYKVCLTKEDCEIFKKEFNSKNTLSTVPDWYMYCDGPILEIELTEKQNTILLQDKRVWQSSLLRI